MKLHDSIVPSGNAYKAQLVLHQLGHVYDTIDYDTFATPSETRLAGFLAKNPNGRIPVLELDDGTWLPESNAIMFYLAEGTPLLPDSRLGRAQVLQWLLFEQYSHEPYVAVLKYWTYWGGLERCLPSDLERYRTRGQAALDVMEKQLDGRTFFVGERYSIADVALFAYTQSAAGVGFRIAPNVAAWLERVRAEPGYVPMKRDPTGKAPDCR